MKNGKLNGKVAVVTGASKGIGAGIAKQFAAEGASVVVNYASSKTDADKIVDEIMKRGGTAVAVQGNVAKKAEVEGLFAAAEKAFGSLAQPRQGQSHPDIDRVNVRSPWPIHKRTKTIFPGCKAIQRRQPHCGTLIGKTT